MKTYWLTLTLAAALGLATGLPAVTTQRTESRQEAVMKTLPQDSASTRANPAAPIDDYVAREAQAKDLESFTGGRHEEVVFVGCGCVALVILILILL